MHSRKPILRGALVGLAVGAALLLLLWGGGTVPDPDSGGKTHLWGELRYWCDRVTGRATSGDRAFAAYARNILESGQGGSHFYSILAEWEHKYGSETEAIALLELGMALSPEKDITCYDRLARYHIERNRTELAIGARPAWMAEDWSFYSWIASKEAAVGRIVSARKHYEQSLRMLQSYIEDQKRNQIWIMAHVPKPPDDATSSVLEEYRRTRTAHEKAVDLFSLTYELNAARLRRELEALPK